MQATAIRVTEAAFTCYPVLDMPRARKFYEGLMNLAVTNEYDMDGNLWVEYDLNGTTFTLGYMKDGPKPTSDGAMIAFEVQDFDGTVSALKEANVKFLMEPFQTPGCRMAIVQDTEGNSIMLHKLNEGRCNG